VSTVIETNAALNVRIKYQDPLTYRKGVPCVELILRPQDQEAARAMEPAGEMYVTAYGETALDIAGRDAYRGRATLSADGKRLLSFQRVGERVSLPIAIDSLEHAREESDAPATKKRFDAMIDDLRTLERAGEKEILVEPSCYFTDWENAIYGMPRVQDIDDVIAQLHVAMEQDKGCLQYAVGEPEYQAYLEEQIQSVDNLIGRVQSLKAAGVTRVVGPRNRIADAITVTEHELWTKTLLQEATQTLKERGVSNLFFTSAPHEPTPGTILVRNAGTAAVYLGNGEVCLAYLEPTQAYRPGEYIIVSDKQIDAAITQRETARDAREDDRRSGSRDDVRDRDTTDAGLER